MDKIISFNGGEIKLDLNRPIYRYKYNPIITCRDVNKVWKDPKFQVVTVHNSGIAEYDGNIVMLFRSHLRCGTSILGLATSVDGISNWEISKNPVMTPATITDSFGEGVDVNEIIENESGGVEDPRICKIDDIYYITYSAYHSDIKNRVRVSLATTKDFKTFIRYGSMLDTDMRNVVIFSEKYNDKYIALFRPNDDTKGDVGGIFKQILIGEAPDIILNKWSVNKNPIIEVKDGPGAFCEKIGPGATPIKTKYGWINIFHGVRGTMDGNPYVLGVALHDLENPNKVKVSNIPILFPSKADCRVSDDDYVHVPNVVFTCGAVRKKDGAIYIYYGGNDTVMNLCVTHEDILVELCNYS